MPQLVDKGQYYSLQKSGWEQFSESLPWVMKALNEVYENQANAEDAAAQFQAKLTEMNPKKAKALVDLLPPQVKKRLKISPSWQPRAMTPEEQASEVKAQSEIAMQPTVDATTVALKRQAEAGAAEAEAKIPIAQAKAAAVAAGGIKKWIAMGSSLQEAAAATADEMDPAWGKTIVQMTSQVGPEYEAYRAGQFFQTMMQAGGGEHPVETGDLAKLWAKNDISGMQTYVQDWQKKHPNEQSLTMTVALKQIQEETANRMQRSKEHDQDVARYEGDLSFKLRTDSHGLIPFESAQRIAHNVSTNLPAAKWDPRDKKYADDADRIAAEKLADDTAIKIRGMKLDEVKNTLSLVAARLEQAKAKAGTGKPVPPDQWSQELLDKMTEDALKLNGITQPEKGTSIWAAGAALVKAGLSNPQIISKTLEETTKAVGNAVRERRGMAAVGGLLQGAPGTAVQGVMEPGMNILSIMAKYNPIYPLVSDVPAEVWEALPAAIGGRAGEIFKKKYTDPITGQPAIPKTIDDRVLNSPEVEGLVKGIDTKYKAMLADPKVSQAAKTQMTKTKAWVEKQLRQNP